MAISYTVLGIMSGSSLDGIDLALCKFELDKQNKWHFQILKAETHPYPDYCLKTLVALPMQSGNKLVEEDINYGKYLGEVANSFLKKHKLTADFISSHGHTIFHQPDKAYTFQLGNGQALSTLSGFTAICDFRSKDILLGGQGAPLVPIGDEMLFSDFDICLNIGGIANISYKKDGKRLAHDVCPANQLLNFLSSLRGFAYDEDGNLASSGKVNNKLLQSLNRNTYYKLNAPKSLSNNYVQDSFIGTIKKIPDTAENKLRTCIEHIVFQIKQDIEDLPQGKILVTGGGAHNSFLINRIRETGKHQVVIPDKTLVDFKEALIFAFMGVLRFRNEVNCLASVTGAKRDCSSGIFFNP